MAKKKGGLIKPCYLKLKRLNPQNGKFLRSLECRVVLKRLTKSNKYYRRYLRRIRESRPKNSEIRKPKDEHNNNSSISKASKTTKRHEEHSNNTSKSSIENRQTTKAEYQSKVAKTSEIRKGHEDQAYNTSKSSLENRQTTKAEYQSKVAKTSEIRKGHEDKAYNSAKRISMENGQNIKAESQSKVAKLSEIRKGHEDQAYNSAKRVSKENGQNIKAESQSKVAKPTEVKKYRSFSLSDQLFGSAFDPKYEKAKITKETKIVKVKNVSLDTKAKKEKLERRLIKECHRRKIKVVLRRLTKADLKLTERKPKVDKLRHFRIPKITKTNQLERSKPLYFNALPASNTGSEGKDVTAPKRVKKRVRFQDTITVQEYVRESDSSLLTSTPVSSIKSGQQLKVKSLNQYMKERHPTAIKSQSIANGVMVKKILDTFLSEIVLETRWFCPICDHFDLVPCFEERHVKMHIAVQHGKSLLDLNIGELQDISELHGDYQCNYEQCNKLFAREEDLLTHISFDHKKLFQKVSELGLNMSDYQPLSNSRKGKEMRWQCLRCPIKFASRFQLMLHLTLAHYYEIMSCHLQTEVVVYPIVYKCLQVGCHLGFKTIPALLSHEQMKHRAFEKFIGTIIGRNDLYKELH